MGWLNRRTRLNAAIAAWRQKIADERAAAEAKAAAELEAQRVAEETARLAAQAAAEARAAEEAAAAQSAAEAKAAAEAAAAQASAQAYADSLVANFEALPTSSADSRGSLLMSDGEGGAFWAYMGGTGTGAQVDNTQWLYRSIYTHGYLAGGYKGSNPWRSVNKTWHATEITMYMGEQLHTTGG